MPELSFLREHGCLKKSRTDKEVTQVKGITRANFDPFDLYDSYDIPDMGV
jgi:hypothetical protein